MKIKTYFEISAFTPSADDVQFARQISDHPLFPTKIGRILVVTKYFPDADNHRLTIYGYLVHVDLETMETVSSFKKELEDWIVSDDYKVVLRDSTGQMIPNGNFIPENEREEYIEYSEDQLTPYQILPAYIRFSRMIKTYAVPVQVLFEKIVEIDDFMNNIFDQYANIQQYLLNKPLDFENPTITNI